MEIKLLVVEDDEDNVRIYESQIKDYNREHVNDVKIIPFFKKNLIEGLNALRVNSYDAAIVDIKLSSDDTAGEGNQILKEIKSNLRFPVFIVTGYPQDIEDELREENIFWNIYSRDNVEIGSILNKIVRIVKTGIISILGNKGYIENCLRKIFWEHIAENFEEILKFSPDNGEEQVLIRYVSAHLMEYLDVKSSPDIPYIPAEFYLKPPVRSEYFTGDILKKTNEEVFFVILTPPCDMVKRNTKGGNEFRNAEKFLIAQMVPFEDLNYINSKGEFKGKFVELLRNPKNSQEFKNTKSTLKIYVQNNKERYHFTPPFYKDIPAGFIDFQALKSLSENEIEDNYDRIASISPLFMKDIIARFSRYYARQGQPDFDIEKILMEILSDESSESNS